MADNTALSAPVGSGDTIRTLEDSDSVKWPTGVVCYATALGTPDALQVVTPSTPLPCLISDGTLTATIRDTGSSDSLNVAIVDASGNQIVSFGGGTQYAEGATAATITGTAAMWEDAADTLRAVSLAKPLPIQPGTGAVFSLIAGQTSITAAAGNVAANTPRVTLADDDPLVDVLQGVADATITAGLRVNPIHGVAGVQGGAGAVTALTQRVAIATDANVVDTELPAAAALDDGMANPTAPAVGAFLMGWDEGEGAWFRVPVIAGEGLLISGQVTVAGTVNVDFPAVDANSGALTGNGQTLEIANLTNGENSVSFQISGTWTGTISFEAGDPTYGWTPIQLVNQATGQVVTSTTANGRFVGQFGPATRVRAIASGWSSGTAVLFMVAAVTGGPQSVQVGDGGQSLSIDDGGNVITVDGTVDVGTVTTVSTVTAVSDASVQGKAAHGASASGNPVLMGGFASASAPTNVDENDVARVWVDLAGRVQVGDGGGSITVDNAGITTLAGIVTSARAAVNPIAGQAGVSAGAGAVDATTQRTTLASDDPAVALLGTIDADTGAIKTAVELLDDAVYADDADWTDGTSKHILIGGLYQSVPQSITDGDVGPLQVTANGYLITSVASSALPTGAATAANQATIIGHVDGIEGLLTTIDADISALAGCVSGTELQVDVVAPLPAGTNAIGKLAANSGVDIGDVDVLTVSGQTLTFGAGVVAAGTPRMTLASDDPAVALLTTIDTDTGNILTSVQLLDDAVYADDDDWTDNSSKHLLVGGVYQSSPHTVTDGDVTPFLTDANGRLIAAISSVGGTVTITGTVTANAGTNLNTSALALESGGNLAAAATSLAVLDDWDESDRAKVNPIAGQAGVQGGSGTVTALTQRVVLATDVALPAGSNAIGKLAANSGVDIGDVDVTSQEARYSKAEAGTAVVWGEDGASGVTLVLSLDALANDAGRMGASADLGAAYDQEYEVYLTVETGTAPTAGNVVELYLACSRDGSEWPGKVTGSDAAYPATVDANKKQLWPPVTQLVATADGNTTLRQNPVIWRPTGRYVAPVVVNKLGQAFRNQTTNSDNTSRVILVPRRAKQQDSA